MTGSPVVWTYEVTNIGNVALENVAVTDSDPTVVVDCSMVQGGPPKNNLPVNQGMVCVANGVAAEGPYENTGTAVGTVRVLRTNGIFESISRTASEADHYFGANPEVTIVKKTGTDSTNVTDNNTAPGPVILVGDPVAWTFTVSNTGNVALTELTVTDNVLGAICAIDSLLPDASRSCTAAGTALRDQHQNIGTASVTFGPVLVDGTRRTSTVTKLASDVDHYFGAAPEIAVLKTTGTDSTNGTDNNVAPGPVILAGDPVVWTYLIKNTGNVPLSSITVADDPLGAICTLESLPAGESHPCSKTGTAQRDQHKNTATATGHANVLTVTGPRAVSRTANDVDHYFGAAPEVKLVKLTGTNNANSTDNNSAPGPVILVGDPVLWTYVVKNTGNVALTDLTVTDDPLGAICPIESLAVGESRPCTKTGTAERGQHQNTGTATARADVLTVTGQRSVIRTANDVDHYFGADPKIAIVKKTNGTDNNVAPGPFILARDLVTSMPGGGHKDDDRKDEHSGEYERHADNHKGEHGKDDGHQDGNRKDKDADRKDDDRRDGDRKDDETKERHRKGQVKWSYTVTNTGNVALTGVAVVDDKVGAICTIGALAAGATTTCAKTADPVPGQYQNTGTTNGNADVLTVDGRKLVTVTASDVDHYFGVDPNISIVKTTNGTNNDRAPGPSILVGTLVTWTYVVRNTGNVPLTNVVVVDDKVGPICTVVSLSAGAISSCASTAAAVKGSYKNVGSAVANVTIIAADGVSQTIRVADRDVDHYLGIERRPPPQACSIYAVHDKGLNDSQFYSIDLLTRIVRPVGPLYTDHDIEAFDDDPITGRLYAAAGRDNRFGQDGYLFELSPLTGALTPIGHTGFSEVVALAFRPDGTLYAWAENTGLLEVNVATGQATLILDDGLNVEGMAWNNSGTLLYLGKGSRLFTYDPVSGDIDELASNLPSSIEGLEFRPDGLLAVGVHGASTIYAYDVNAKKVVVGEQLSTGPYEDAEGIAWTCPAAAGGALH